MTVRDMNGGFLFLSTTMLAGSGTTSGTTLDATNEQAAMVTQAPKAGIIDTVYFRVGTVTTGGTIMARIEGVTGLSSTIGAAPSAALVAAGAEGSVAIGSGDDNEWMTVTLGTPYTVGRGELISVVLNLEAGGGDMQIRHQNSWAPSSAGTFPRSLQKLSAGFTWANTNAPFCIALGYSDEAVLSASMIGALGGVSLLSVATNTTPDEVGNKWVANFNGTITGIQIFGGITSPAAYDLIVYDASNGVITSISVPANYTSSAYGTKHFLFPDEVNFLIGDVLRFILKPTTTTAFSTALHDLPIAVAEQMGGTYEYTRRTDGGAWTDTPLACVAIHPVFGGFDDGDGVPPPVESWSQAA